MKRYLPVLICYLIFPVIVFSSGPSSQDYSISRHVFSCGGKLVSSGSYQNRSSLGQPCAFNVQASQHYSNHSGFWNASESFPTPTPTNFVSPTSTPMFTLTPTPFPTDTATPAPTSSGSKTPTFTPTTSESPTYTPTPGGTSNPTVTNTPEVCERTGVELWMPSHMFAPGDSCGCIARVCNAEGIVIESYPLFVILEVYGSYFFAPSFDPVFDSYLEQHRYFDIGTTEIVVIPTFLWPVGVGSANGINWYSALTDPEITQLFGEMDSWTFGWRD